MQVQTSAPPASPTEDIEDAEIHDELYKFGMIVRVCMCVCVVQSMSSTYGNRRIGTCIEHAEPRVRPNVQNLACAGAHMHRPRAQCSVRIHFQANTSKYIRV